MDSATIEASRSGGGQAGAALAVDPGSNWSKLRTAFRGWNPQPSARRAAATAGSDVPGTKVEKKCELLLYI